MAEIGIDDRLWASHKPRMRKAHLLVLSTLSILAFPAEAAPPVGAAAAAPAVAPARPTAQADDDTPSLVGIASLQSVPDIAKTKPVNAVKQTPLAIASEEVEQFRPIITKVGKRVIAPTRTCKAEDLKFTWPVQGAAGKVWVTNNYTDLDPSSQKKDYKGAVGPAAMNYDGHRGYDICVSSFREMDGNVVPARAAAPGKVIEVDDDNFDRNTSCTGTWNYVLVEHSNGFVSYYGHLKKGSAKVKVNDIVTTGQSLGIIGSSGCSTNPHLHFEVHNCDNEWVEPAKLGMWYVAPSSQEVSGVMDVMLRASTSTNAGISVADLKDPKPNPTTLQKNGVLLVGFTAALREGDKVSVGVYTTKGEVKKSYWDVTGRYSQRFVFFDQYKIGDNYTGPAYVSVFLNGKLAAIRMVTVQ